MSMVDDVSSIARLHKSQAEADVLRDMYFTESPGVIVEFCDAVIDLVEKHQAEIGRLKAEQPKWIPVDERLPDDYEKVLIYDKTWGILPGWHMRSGDWGTSEVKNVTEITHWMPNPKPPKEGDT